MNTVTCLVFDLPLPSLYSQYDKTLGEGEETFLNSDFPLIFEWRADLGISLKSGKWKYCTRLLNICSKIKVALNQMFKRICLFSPQKTHIHMNHYVHLSYLSLADVTTVVNTFLLWEMIYFLWDIYRYRYKYIAI